MRVWVMEKGTDADINATESDLKLSSIEKYLPWLALLAFLLLVAGFVVIGHVI